MPLSSAASATTILKVEPGGYWPASALLVSGAFSLASSPRQFSPLMPLVNRLGSKLGVETIDSTSPFVTSITTEAPL